MYVNIKVVRVNQKSVIIVSPYYYLNTEVRDF